MASANVTIQSCNKNGGEKCGHNHRDLQNASICSWRAHTDFLVNLNAEGKPTGKPYARQPLMEALKARAKRLGPDSTDSRWDTKKTTAKKTASKKANTTKKAASKKAAAKKTAAKAPAKKAASAKPAVATADSKKKAA